MLTTDLYIEMGNLVDTIYKYFADEKVPLSTKVKLTILALLALVLADNHYGFSHIVINSYKVDYMMKLEEAKQRYKEDTAFVAEIDHLIEIERSDLTADILRDAKGKGNEKTVPIATDSLDAIYRFVKLIQGER